MRFSEKFQQNFNKNNSLTLKTTEDLLNGSATQATTILGGRQSIHY